jgi:hypothetical protein
MDASVAVTIEFSSSVTVDEHSHAASVSMALTPLVPRRAVKTTLVGYRRSSQMASMLQGYHIKRPVCNSHGQMSPLSAAVTFVVVNSINYQPVFVFASFAPEQKSRMADVGLLSSVIGSTIDYSQSADAETAVRIH